MYLTFPCNGNITQMRAFVSDSCRYDFLIFEKSPKAQFFYLRSSETYSLPKKGENVINVSIPVKIGQMLGWKPVAGGVRHCRLSGSTVIPGSSASNTDNFCISTTTPVSTEIVNNQQAYHLGKCNKRFFSVSTVVTPSHAPSKQLQCAKLFSLIHAIYLLIFGRCTHTHTHTYTSVLHVQHSIFCVGFSFFHFFCWLFWFFLYLTLSVVPKYWWVLRINPFTAKGGKYTSKK